MNTEHVELLKNDVIEWNQWREQNPDITPDLQGADLTEANLQWANLQEVNLQGADLMEANLQWANLQGAKLQKANLQRTVLQGAELIGADLMEADLMKANLQDANLQGANLQGADLMEANLQWANLQEVNLQGADLMAANLQEANLQEAELQGADLMKANLKGAKLIGADLIGADLIGADLQWANLQGADLMEANLQGAELQWANLTGADLQGANLKGANLQEANLINTHVRGVRYDKKMECRAINVHGCYGNQRFVRHVMDLDYTEEIKEKHPCRYKLWKLTSDCGRSWERWAIWSIVTALVFGTVFLPSVWWESLPHRAQMVLPHLNFNVPAMDVSAYTPYYFSIVTFTTLGFGDITPLNLAGQIWLTLEVIAGYIMLGGLITLFAAKMVRQSV